MAGIFSKDIGEVQPQLADPRFASDTATGRAIPVLGELAFSIRDRKKTHDFEKELDRIINARDQGTIGTEMANARITALNRRMSNEAPGIVSNMKSALSLRGVSSGGLKLTQEEKELNKRREQMVTLNLNPDNEKHVLFYNQLTHDELVSRANKDALANNAISVSDAVNKEVDLLLNKNFNAIAALGSEGFDSKNAIGLLRQQADQVVSSIVAEKGSVTTQERAALQAQVAARLAPFEDLATSMDSLSKANRDLQLSDANFKKAILEHPEIGPVVQFLNVTGEVGGEIVKLGLTNVKEFGPEIAKIKQSAAAASGSPTQQFAASASDSFADFIKSVDKVKEPVEQWQNLSANDIKTLNQLLPAAAKNATTELGQNVISNIAATVPEALDTPAGIVAAKQVSGAGKAAFNALSNQIGQSRQELTRLIQQGAELGFKDGQVTASGMPNGTAITSRVGFNEKGVVVTIPAVKIAERINKQLKVLDELGYGDEARKQVENTIRGINDNANGATQIRLEAIDALERGADPVAVEKRLNELLGR